VHVTPLTQPDPSERSIGESVAEALAWPDARAAWFAVAWAKRSGLDVLEQPIRALRRRRRPARALIGVDQHGGTVEALQQALGLFTEARIYHDTALFKTFHPKLYVIEGTARARVVVGSGNLTEGGLSFNYELAVQLDLDLSEQQDVGVLDTYRQWFDRRWTNADAARKLTATLITQLVNDPRVVVVPEASVPPPRQQRRGASTTASVFGPAVRGLRSRTGRRRGRDSDAADTTTPTAASGGGTRASGPSSAPPAARRGARDLVLAAGLPNDRPGQAGFNAVVVRDFFGVQNSGDSIWAEAIDRQGNAQLRGDRVLVYPAGSNQNHRIELRDPDGRTRTPGTYPVLLARRLRRGRFRYVYLYPGDAGYAPIKAEMAARDGVGISNLADTKRVYLTLAEAQQVWPGCPL
jgi:HKD family nuclease